MSYEFALIFWWDYCWAKIGYKDQTFNLFDFAEMTMTARDFVMSSMKKNESFGVDGYLLAKTMTNFDKPLAARIHAGKKKTFVDDAVKVKKHVPDANYNVSIDWTKDKKSNLCKDFRHTIPTDIER